MENPLNLEKPYCFFLSPTTSVTILLMTITGWQVDLNLTQKITTYYYTYTRQLHLHKYSGKQDHTHTHLGYQT